MLFGGAVQRDGISAQAEAHGKGHVVGHRQRERAQRGETAGDHLRDGEQIGGLARMGGVQRLQRRHAGEADIASVVDKEQRGEKGGDDLAKNVGRAV